MSITDDDINVYLQTAVAAICDQHGIEYINSSSLELLTQLLLTKIINIASLASESTHASDRIITNTTDISMAILADKHITEGINHYDFTELLKYTKSCTHVNTPHITINTDELNMNPSSRVEYDYTMIYPIPGTSTTATTPLTQTQSASAKAMQSNHFPPFLPPQSALTTSTIAMGSNVSNSTIISQQYSNMYNAAADSNVAPGNNPPTANFTQGQQGAGTNKRQRTQ